MPLSQEDLQAIAALIDEKMKPFQRMAMDINAVDTKLSLMEYHVEAIANGYEEMRSDVSHTQLNVERLTSGQAGLMEQITSLKASVLQLENSVVHQLRLLNENLPDVMARRESIVQMRSSIDDFGSRIFALEQAWKREHSPQG